MKSVIISIIMFLFLILIHEFGHFIIAKKSGIRVNELAIGMGPKIFSKQKGETLYSVNLFPIGGYCAMEGEDSESDDERSFDKAPAYKRFFTILAGPDKAENPNFPVNKLLRTFIIKTIIEPTSLKPILIDSKNPTSLFFGIKPRRGLLFSNFTLTFFSIYLLSLFIFNDILSFFPCFW